VLLQPHTHAMTSAKPALPRRFVIVGSI
jgi:hypothetical protein